MTQKNVKLVLLALHVCLVTRKILLHNICCMNEFVVIKRLAWLRFMIFNKYLDHAINLEIFVDVSYGTKKIIKM